ncbi:MAG TPA: hypothetical protein VF318_03045 [Dehalococcoidales bacterium]
MLDRIRGGMAMAVCFLFGHVHYQEGKYTGKIAYTWSDVRRIMPVVDIEKNQICPRCGKELKSKIRLKKGDK